MGKHEQVVLIMGGGSKYFTNEPIIASGLEGFNIKQVVACELGEEGLDRFVAYILTNEGNLLQWGPSCCWNSVLHKSRLITSGSLIEKSVASIARGFNHFAAATKDGELYTWGKGGVLGHGDIKISDQPKKVEALAGIHIVQVACLYFNTLALSQNGKVYAFGYNCFGCNGNGKTEGYQYLPEPIEGLPPIIYISSGIGNHTAAICRQGNVYTWGDGNDGRLGHVDVDVDEICSTPKKIESLSHERIVQVSCGKSHTAALTAEGKVYSFGSGESGKLGHNDVDCQTAPKLVEALEATVISQVSCGRDYTCFLSEAGKLYLCGDEKHRHGSGTNILVPQTVQSFKKYKVSHISSLTYSTIALATWEAVAPNEMPISVSLRSMVNHEEFADVVFQTDEGQVFAHKNLLAQRSDFFRAMITSGMKESSSRMIQLSNVTKSTLLLVFEYLYTGNVVVPLAAVVDLYVAADMYGLGHLKEICRESLSNNIVVSNAAKLLLEVSESSAEELTNICFQYVVGNMKAVSKTAGMVQVAEDSELMLKVLREAADLHM